MSQYPRDGSKITMFLSDGSEVTGAVNIAGRDLVSYLLTPDPDILLYDRDISSGTSARTLFISKKHVVWIAPVDSPAVRVKGVWWKEVKFLLENGDKITGSVNVTGYDRLSDFFRMFDEQFLEVYDCCLGNREFELLYIALSRVIWKVPVYG